MDFQDTPTCSKYLEPESSTGKKEGVTYECQDDVLTNIFNLVNINNGVDLAELPRLYSSYFGAPVCLAEFGLRSWEELIRLSSESLYIRTQGKQKIVRIKRIKKSQSVPDLSKKTMPEGSKLKDRTTDTTNNGTEADQLSVETNMLHLEATTPENVPLTLEVANQPPYCRSLKKNNDLIVGLKKSVHVVCIELGGNFWKERDFAISFASQAEIIKRNEFCAHFRQTITIGSKTKYHSLGRLYAAPLGSGHDLHRVVLVERKLYQIKCYFVDFGIIRWIFGKYIYEAPAIPNLYDPPLCRIGRVKNQQQKSKCKLEFGILHEFKTVIHLLDFDESQNYYLVQADSLFESPNEDAQKQGANGNTESKLITKPPRDLHIIEIDSMKFVSSGCFSNFMEWESDDLLEKCKNFCILPQKIRSMASSQIDFESVTNTCPHTDVNSLLLPLKSIPVLFKMFQSNDCFVLEIKETLERLEKLK